MWAEDAVPMMLQRGRAAPRLDDQYTAILNTGPSGAIAGVMGAYLIKFLLLHREQSRALRERLAGVARFHGNLIGAKYGEPFVVKEMMRVDDVVSMGVRSL